MFTCGYRARSACPASILCKHTYAHGRAPRRHTQKLFGKNIDQCRFPCFVRNCFHRLKQLNHRPSLFSHQFCPRSSLLTNTPGTHTPVFVFNFLFWQWKLQAAAHCASARPDSIPRSVNGGEGRLDSCWSTLILDSTCWWRGMCLLSPRACPALRRAVCLLLQLCRCCSLLFNSSLPFLALRKCRVLKALQAPGIHQPKIKPAIARGHCRASPRYAYDTEDS